MPVKYRTTITMSGPFFRGDPRKKFAENKRSFMEQLAEIGEADVVGQLRAGQGDRYPLGMGLGRVADHVHGRVESLSGKHWKATAVVSINNRGLSKAQGIKLMAAASYLERTGHAMRRTKGRLLRTRKPNIDLLKGLR